MQHDITKLCALSLRTFLKNDHGIELKSGHAHELVAAFFGYKSAISLRQDTQYPLSNLERAEFIHFDPDLSLVNQRIKELQLDLPGAVILAEGFYTPLMDEKWLVEKIWPTFHDLAVYLAEKRLQERLEMLRIPLDIIKFDMAVDIEEKGDSVLFVIDVGYPANAGKRLRDSKFVINLPRVAANMGYGKPKIEETRYSGDAQKYSDAELLKRYPIPLGIA